MTIQTDGYTFALSDEVTRTPVRYKNRYGIDIAGDLYQRKGLHETTTHPAIVIGPRTVVSRSRARACTPKSWRGAGS